MKPNLFHLAPKELSQDAFFTWLLQWADDSNNKHDPELNETAKDFVRWLLEQTSDYKITNIEVKKQWQNIDICAKINDEYILVIEDKTNSGERINQLEKYRKFVTDYYKNENYKFVFIYLKTGNESSTTLDKIRKQFYVTPGRIELLKTLGNPKVKNIIFSDFVENLKSIETKTNSFLTFKNVTSDIRAAEGLYIFLQSKLQNSDWGGVSNPSGGFLGLWYHEKQLGTLKLYIQIENAVDNRILDDIDDNQQNFKDRIKIVIKVSGKLEIEQLRQMSIEIQPFADKHGLVLRKPKKHRVGNTSTLVIFENAFPDNTDNNLNIIQFIQSLTNLELVLDEYVMSQSLVGIKNLKPTNFA